MLRFFFTCIKLLRLFKTQLKLFQTSLKFFEPLPHISSMLPSDSTVCLKLGKNRSRYGPQTREILRDRQYGFRERYSTTDQAYRRIALINKCAVLHFLTQPMHSTESGIKAFSSNYTNTFQKLSVLCYSPTSITDNFESEMQLPQLSGIISKLGSPNIL